MGQVWMQKFPPCTPDFPPCQAWRRFESQRARLEIPLALEISPGRTHSSLNPLWSPAGAASPPLLPLHAGFSCEPLFPATIATSPCFILSNSSCFVKPSLFHQPYQVFSRFFFFFFFPPHISLFSSHIKAVVIEQLPGSRAALLSLPSSSAPSRLSTSTLQSWHSSFLPAGMSLRAFWAGSAGWGPCSFGGKRIFNEPRGSQAWQNILKRRGFEGVLGRGWDNSGFLGWKVDNCAASSPHFTFIS